MVWSRVARGREREGLELAEGDGILIKKYPEVTGGGQEKNEKGVSKQERSRIRTARETGVGADLKLRQTGS